VPRICDNFVQKSTWHIVDIRTYTLLCSVEILPKGVLLFKSVHVNDSAVYSCRAVNAFGSTTLNISLVVLGELQKSMDI